MVEYKDIAEERLEICKKCGLYKEGALGPICNSRMYISETDKESISDKPKNGYRRGCGCLLTRKVKMALSHCIVNKW